MTTHRPQLSTWTLLLSLLTLPVDLANSQSSPVPASPELVEQLELFWSYGRSPPVYPSRTLKIPGTGTEVTLTYLLTLANPPIAQGNGTGDWAEAYQFATSLVAQMTNEEKQNVTFGGSGTTNGCAGFSPGVIRLGYGGLCFDDGPSGIRATDMVNGYPSGITVGASWNKTLAYERGRAMGAEAKAKGGMSCVLCIPYLPTSGIHVQRLPSRAVSLTL